jgi:hypothetical protein
MAGPSSVNSELFQWRFGQNGSLRYWMYAVDMCHLMGTKFWGWVKDYDQTPPGKGRWLGKQLRYLLIVLIVLSEI